MLTQKGSWRSSMESGGSDRQQRYNRPQPCQPITSLLLFLLVRLCLVPLPKYPTSYLASMPAAPMCRLPSLTALAVLLLAGAAGAGRPMSRERTGPSAEVRAGSRTWRVAHLLPPATAGTLAAPCRLAAHSINHVALALLCSHW